MVDRLEVDHFVARLHVGKKHIALAMKNATLMTMDA